MPKLKPDGNAEDGVEKVVDWGVVVTKLKIGGLVAVPTVLEGKTEVEGPVELTDVFGAAPKNKLWVEAPVLALGVTDDVGLVEVDVGTLSTNVLLDTVVTEVVVEGLPITNVCFIVVGTENVGMVDVEAVTSVAVLGAELAWNIDKGLVVAVPNTEGVAVVESTDVVTAEFPLTEDGFTEFGLGTVNMGVAAAEKLAKLLDVTDLVNPPSVANVLVKTDGLDWAKSSGLDVKLADDAGTDTFALVVTALKADSFDVLTVPKVFEVAGLLVCPKKRLLAVVAALTWREPAAVVTFAPKRLEVPPKLKLGFAEATVPNVAVFVTAVVVTSFLFIATGTTDNPLPKLNCDKDDFVELAVSGVLGVGGALNFGNIELAEPKE